MIALNQSRLSLLLTYVSLLALILCNSSPSYAAVYNVNTGTALQSALDSAVAGDEIVVEINRIVQAIENDVAGTVDILARI